MELPVSAQLWELGWALALGLGLGLLNGLLRPLRRGRGRTALADGFWCLVLLAALLAFPLYAGRGRLRAADLLAMALSGGLWTGLTAALRRALKKRQKAEKNLRKKQKKCCILRRICYNNLEKALCLPGENPPERRSPCD